MSGNNGRVGRCTERCRGCLNWLRNLPFYGEHLHSILTTIWGYDYCKCCFWISRKINCYYMAIIATVGFTAFTALAWLLLSPHTAHCATVYCAIMVAVALFSRCCKRGKCGIKRVKRKIAAQRKKAVVEQSSGELSDGGRPLELEDPNIVYQGPDGAAAPEMRHRVEVNIADEPNESANLGEHASRSRDEPSQQAAAAAADSGSNLRRSSTDPSTPSTSTTPLE